MNPKQFIEDAFKQISVGPHGQQLPDHIRKIAWMAFVWGMGTTIQYGMEHSESMSEFVEETQRLMEQDETSP